MLTDKYDIQIRPELVSKTAFLYVSTLASAVLGYIALLLAARYVGQVAYGTVAFVLSFEGVFLFVTDFGFSRPHMKKIAEGYDMQACLGVYMFARLIFTIAYVVVVLVSIWLWEGLWSSGDEPSEMRHVMMIMLAYYVPVSIRWFFVYTFYAQRDVVRAQFVTLAELVVRSAATASVVVFDLGVIGLAWSFSISGILSLVFAYMVSRKRFPRFSLIPVPRNLLKEYFFFALPIAASLILGTMCLYLDKIIIQASLTVVDTGTYFASQRFLAAYLSLGSVVVAIAFPTVSQLNVLEGSRDRIRSMTMSSVRYLSIIVIPATFFLVVFAEPTLSIFLSEAFENGAFAFSLLVIAYSLFIVTAPLTSQVLGMGFAGEYARYNIIYSALVIALDVLLIPSELMSIRLLGLGINGAAMAILLAQVVNTYLFCTCARRILDLRFPVGLLRLTTASTLSILVTYYVSTLFLVDRFYDVLALSCMFLSLYTVISLLFRALTVSEISELIGMLSARSLLKRNSSSDNRFRVR